MNRPVAVRLGPLSAVRPGEGRLVGHLVLVFFLVGSGLALGRGTADGGEVIARDYVVVAALPRAGGLSPARDAIIDLPAVFRWAPVPGAARYQVYVRDLWQPGDAPVHQSGLLTDTRYEVPAAVLQPGGQYSWKVHARDVDEHVLLGDYNHGSQSEWTPFEVAGEP